MSDYIVKVENINGILVTTSNRVAEELGVNHKDLLEKIAYYLNNDTKREKIANQGGAYVNEYYSFDKSLQKIFRGNKWIIGENRCRNIFL